MEEFPKLIPVKETTLSLPSIRLNCLAIASIRVEQRPITYLANEYFNFVMNGMSENGVIYTFETDIPRKPPVKNEK